MSTTLERDIGTMQSDIKHLANSTNKLEKDLQRLQDDIADIKRTLHTVGGGWKAMVMFGSFCAAVGSLVSQGVKLIWQ